MSGRWWPAPAKLNLFLHVLGRRADGYHELETVFQLLDFGDEMLVEPRADGRVRRREGLAEVPPEADLAVRAALLLQARSGVSAGADISIRKRIPAGGGLGGGSSDAATVLCVLDRLWGTALGTERLAALGRELGADVPVFVRGHAAWARGVGERLRAVRIAPAAWFAVWTPPCVVPTAAVFGAASLTRNTPESRIESFLLAPAGAGDDGFPRLSLATLLERGRNDCEAVVGAAYPLVREAMQLTGGAPPARLTGTGASVFAAFAAREEAEAVLARLPAGWRGFVARGVNRSPLHEALAG